MDKFNITLIILMCLFFGLPLIALITKIVKSPYRHIFNSKIPNYEGLCKLTWINTNSVMNRLDCGVTVFAKQVKLGLFGMYWKTGPEFHGMIIGDNIVSAEKKQY